MQATRLSRSTAANHDLSASYPSPTLASHLPTGSKPSASFWRLAVSKRLSIQSTRLCAAVLLLLLAFAPAAYSQMMSGQITGRLADSGGAVIPGARVQLTNELTSQAREFLTDSSGSFTF